MSPLGQAFVAALFAVINLLIAFILRDIKNEIRSVRIDLKKEVDDIREGLVEHLEDHAKNLFALK